MGIFRKMVLNIGFKSLFAKKRILKLFNNIIQYKLIFPRDKMCLHESNLFKKSISGNRIDKIKKKKKINSCINIKIK